MKQLGKRPAIMLATVGALACYQNPARADETADEIRALKTQLRKLEEKVNEQARMQKETRVQIRSVQTHAAPGPTPASYPPGIAIAPLGGAAQTGLAATESAVYGLPTAGSPSLYINGVSITPGGFLALEGVFRNRYLPADVGSVYASIPYYNVRQGYLNEFRLTARQSRASLLAKGDVDPVTHLAGYIEMDFLGAAQTANSNESNSYTPRIRHVYATFDQDDWGAHVLAGQNWSLTTMNTKGIIPRQEDVPLTIDAQYVPGFIWARQPQLRLVKDFGKTFWMGVSVEGAATTFSCAPTGAPTPTTTNTCGSGFVTSGGVPSAATGATFASAPVYNAIPPGGALLNTANAYSFNSVPDVVAKAAWDNSFEGHDIHVEGWGLYRTFTDQIANAFVPSNISNESVWGRQRRRLDPRVRVAKTARSPVFGRYWPRHRALWHSAAKRRHLQCEWNARSGPAD